MGYFTEGTHLTTQHVQHQGHLGLPLLPYGEGVHVYGFAPTAQVLGHEGQGCLAPQLGHIVQVGMAVRASGFVLTRGVDVRQYRWPQAVRSKISQLEPDGRLIASSL